MKKLITITLILAMLLPAAVICEDISAMSDQELKDAITMYSRELASRQTNPDGWILIFEYESVQVYQVGEAKIGSAGIITIPVAVINNFDRRVKLHPQKIQCNGWEIDSWGCDASANSKKKGEINFFAGDAFVSSLDDVSSLTFIWELEDGDYNTIYKQETPEEHRFW
jgi:hypothetical protein